MQPYKNNLHSFSRYSNRISQIFKFYMHKQSFQLLLKILVSQQVLRISVCKILVFFIQHARCQQPQRTRLFLFAYVLPTHLKDK